MKAILFRWVSSNRVILTNAGSLVGATGATSILGFVYWWIAARYYPPAAVGLGSAAVSAMGLLSSVSMLGVGTLLIGELPRRPDRAPSLVMTALLTTGIVGATLGLISALVAGRLSADLRPLAANIGSTMVFALGVSLTTIGLTIDQALVGLLRSDYQLWRNMLFAGLKLLVLWALGVWAASLYKTGLVISITWSGGILASLIFLTLLAARRRYPLQAYRPDWGLVRQFRGAAMAHHALNLTLQVPIMAMPLVVTVLLSAEMNAHFYIAWMIAYFVYIGPSSITTVLHAVGAGHPAALARHIRRTIGLSTIIGVLANVALLIGGDFVLGIFGDGYAQQAGVSLHILAVAVFPLIIRSHSMTIARIHDRVAGAARFMLLGSLLELSLAAIGARLDGLTGLSIGWVVALSIEAAFHVRPVLHAALVSDDHTSHALLSMIRVGPQRTATTVAEQVVGTQSVGD